MGESIGFRDRVLVCSECKAEFVFTAGAQIYFAARGFGDDPKCCRTCYAKHGRGQSLPVETDNPDRFDGGNDDDNRGGNDCNDGIPVTWGPRPFKQPPPPDHNRKECGDN